MYCHIVKLMLTNNNINLTAWQYIPKDSKLHSLLCLLPFHHVIWNSFGGNSADSIQVFCIQKRIIRIIAGAKSRASCTELFKKFNILPLTSEFLLSLLSFIVDNMKVFQTNPDIYSISTRYRYNLYVPHTNLSKRSLLFCN
jgi:hypothetical protein